MSENDEKYKYLFELLESADNIGLSGSIVKDTDGTIIGVMIGEPEFIEMFDYEQNMNRTVH